MFSFAQRLIGKAVRSIADGCQNLKNLHLVGVGRIDNGDVLHVIKKCGGQMTTLHFNGKDLTDVAYVSLKNCAR
jgi:hypothetical protein